MHTSSFDLSQITMVKNRPPPPKQKKTKNHSTLNKNETSYTTQHHLNHKTNLWLYMAVMCHGFSIKKCGHKPLNLTSY
jgi:hypothetical protein